MAKHFGLELKLDTSLVKVQRMDFVKYYIHLIKRLSIVEFATLMENESGATTME